MTNSDWFCIGIAFAVTALGTPLVRAAARRLGMIARPRADRWHKKPTALLGGVAIFLALIAASIQQGIPWVERRWLYLGGIFVFCVGLIDDIWRIKPGQKLLGQIVAATILLLLGPSLPWTPFAFLNGALAFVWIIGITNAINLLDNLDGLATGISLIAATFFSFILGHGDQIAWAVFAAALATALAGFLIYNSYPASIFMGDCGALFIGYVLAAISIRAASTATADGVGPSLAIPVLVLLVPIFDTTFVTLLRKLAGRPASQGGRDHTSHRLVALGWSERQTAWILYALALVAGAIAVLVGTTSPEVVIPLLLLFLTFVIFLGIHLAEVRVYPEEAFQQAKEKRRWIGYCWRAVEWRLPERILDSCLILLVWRWDCKLVVDIASAGEHALLLGAAMVLIKLACFSALGVYRSSWLSPRADQFILLAKAVALAELASFWIWIFPAKLGWASLAISLFDGCALVVILAAVRAAYGALGTLLRVKQV